jgi:site-specific recombinase XerD
MSQSTEASKLQALELLSKTIQKVEGAYAPSTIRAYKEDFLSFIDFCNRLDISSIPASPHSICLFIKELIANGKTSASIRRALVGISKIHQLNMLIDPATHPDVKIEMKRMHRQLGRVSQQAYPITLDTLTLLIPKKASSLRDYRDKALLLLAYDTLARRSELISYQVQDLSIHTKGDAQYYCISIRRSKTDQEASGKVAHLRKATYLATQEWLKNAKINDGLLLRGINRSDTVLPALGAGQINRIYKRLAQMANLDPQIIKRISGHSMRVGAAQDLLLSGASMPMIMSRGRWSKTDTVMRYIENFTSPYEET